MTWNPVGNDTGVYDLEYEAQDYGRTSCVAIKTPRGLLVLSPSVNTPRPDFEWIKAHGGLAGLVAPHGGHTLGFKEWLEEFPNTPVYAAPGSIARLKEIAHVDARPISEISNLDASIHWSIPKASKNDSLLLEVLRGDRPVVYINEIIADLEKDPGKGFISKTIFKLMGLHKGLSINRAYLRIYVKNKKLLRDETLDLLKSDPHVILAHGPIRSSAEDLRKMRGLLNTI